MYRLQEYDTWFWVSFKGMRNCFLLFPCLHRICRFHIFSLTFPDCRCYVLPKFNDVPSSIPSFLWVYKNLTIHFSTIDLPNKFLEFIPPLKFFYKWSCELQMKNIKLQSSIATFCKDGNENIQIFTLQMDWAYSIYTRMHNR